MSHLMNFIPRRLAVFPTEREAMLYARQKLAEGLKLVNVVAGKHGWVVNRAGRLN